MSQSDPNVNMLIELLFPDYIEQLMQGQDDKINIFALTLISSLQIVYYVGIMLVFAITSRTYSIFLCQITDAILNPITHI